MRGGRGSRGGSRGGGRSRSYRSSSRRHYRNRRRYGNVYLFGGYYGRSHSTTTLGRRGSLIVLFIFLGIFYLFASLAAYGIMASPTTDHYYLEPSRQRLIQLPSNLKSARISFPGDIYVMDNIPPTIGNSIIPNQATENIPSDSYVYWQVSLMSGSSIEVMWTATAAVGVYLLEGLSEFNRWVDGETPAGSLKSSAIAGSFSYTASKDLDVYVAFENSGFGNPTIELTRTITITEPRYDTSGGTHFTGEATIELETSKYVVLVNRGLVDLQATVTKEKEFNARQFQLIWGLVTLFLTIAAIYILIKFGDDKPRGVAAPPPPIAPQTTPSVQVQQSSWSAPQQQAQSNTWVAPMVRPPPKYCPSCSAPILDSDRFCGSCGVNLK